MAGQGAWEYRNSTAHEESLKDREAELPGLTMPRSKEVKTEQTSLESCAGKRRQHITQEQRDPANRAGCEHAPQSQAMFLMLGPDTLARIFCWYAMA
jgi:hypothetical protein